MPSSVELAPLTFTVNGAAPEVGVATITGTGGAFGGNTCTTVDATLEAPSLSVTVNVAVKSTAVVPVTM